MKAIDGLNISQNTIDDYMVMELVKSEEEYREIRGYILANFMDGEELKLPDSRRELANKIAKYLVLEKHYTKEAILNGVCNDEIKCIMQMYKMEDASVLKEGESKKKVLLEAIKRKMESKAFRQAITLLGLVAIYSTLLIARYNYSPTREISNNVGRIIAGDYDDTRDIIERNTTKTFDPTTSWINIDYDEAKIAGNILRISVKNPELFDTLMHDAYLNMKIGKSYNMDTVMMRLRLLTSTVPEFSEFSERIEGCDSFFDYIVKSGWLSEDVTPEVLDAISKYNATDHNHDPKAFDNLDTQTKDILYNFMAKYKDYKGNDLNKSAIALEKMVESTIKR